MKPRDHGRLFSLNFTILLGREQSIVSLTFLLCFAQYVRFVPMLQGLVFAWSTGLFSPGSVSSFLSFPLTFLPVYLPFRPYPIFLLRPQIPVQSPLL